MLPVVLRPEAEADLTSARDWYNRRRAGLGSEFLDATSEVLARVAANPEIYAPALRDVRRVKLRRFPYVVYYRVHADRIEVIGVLHGSRDPRIWQRRS